MKGVYHVFQAIGLFILKFWVIIAIRAYYRKIKVIGLEKVPVDSPVIFAPNHQYAFMDALVVGTVNKKIPYFLVRADIFETSVANFLLRALRMLPVYRKRDKGDVISKNEAIFQKCVNILHDRKHLIIFPEGNHSKIRRIRPIRKGILRIAFRAMTEGKNIDDLVIIPIGINYDDQSRFQSDLLVRFGNPVKVAEYMENYENNPSRTFGKITDIIRRELMQLTVNIDNAESYKFYENVLKIYTPHFMQKMKMNYKSLIERFSAYKKIISGMDRIREKGRDDFKRFEAENNRFFKQRLKSYIDPAYLGRYFETRLQKFKNYLGLVLFWPIYLYGVVNNFLGLIIPFVVARLFVRDDHWASSVKLAVGLLSFPLSYLLQAYIFHQFFPDLLYVFLYLSSIIITGILSKIYQNWIHRFWEGFKIWLLKGSNKREFIRIKNSYNELIKKLDKNILKTKDQEVKKVDY